MQISLYQRKLRGKKKAQTAEFSCPHDNKFEAFKTLSWTVTYIES